MRATSRIARQDIADCYAPLSWHCLLAGYGNFPDHSKLKPPGDDIVRIDLAEVERFVGGCALNFPSHGEALAMLREEA